MRGRPEARPDEHSTPVESQYISGSDIPFGVSPLKSRRRRAENSPPRAAEARVQYMVQVDVGQQQAKRPIGFSAFAPTVPPI